MTHVLVGFQVGTEHLTPSHGVLPRLSHIDRGLDGASELQLVGFDRHNTDEWHFDNELLGHLVVKTVFLNVPASAFQEYSLDVSSSLKSLGDLLRHGLLGHDSVESGLVQRPSSGSASCLQQSSQVGSWDLES